MFIDDHCGHYHHHDHCFLHHNHRRYDYYISSVPHQLSTFLFFCYILKLNINEKLPIFLKDFPEKIKQIKEKFGGKN